MNIKNKPPASQFGPAKLWENLSKGPEKSKFIFIEVKDDEHIPKDAYKRYLELARRINHDVYHIFYESKEDWHHADPFYRYEELRHRFMQAVFD